MDLRAIQVDINWHPGLPIYASPAYLQAAGGHFGWIGGLDAQARLRCILPFSAVRRFGLQMIRFRTNTIPLGAEIDLAHETLFLNKTVDYFRSNGADIIIPSGNTAIFRTYPDGAIAAPYGTFVNDLSRPESMLMSKIRKTYRQNIRKAAAAGVEIKSGPEYLGISYELISATLKRTGSTFKTYNDFRDRVLALGKFVTIFVAEHKGVIQGCMVAPFSNHTAYNCYSGSMSTPTLGSMHLLHWEAILHFRRKGVRYFDFQGVRINPKSKSKQQGILHYKQGFGGELIQGYLWKRTLRPVKSVVYSFAVRLIKGGDIVDQEHGKLVSYGVSRLVSEGL